MTNKEILKIAMEQSAIDCNCLPEDFCSGKNKVVISEENPKARAYLKLPFWCDLVYYGNNIVASTDSSITDIVLNYINTYPPEHCFETPNLHVLNDTIQKYGMRICFMAEYFLPDSDIIKPLPCPFEIKFLYPADFKELYIPQWSNALCESRQHLDVMATGAFDNGKLIGLAGCSADCENMRQIGIDVLPGYRNMGIASSLTSTLAVKILEEGKVPFYCCAWSNIASARNALKSGFKPAWAEMTAKNYEFIDNMNKIKSR